MSRPPKPPLTDQEYDDLMALASRPDGRRLGYRALAFHLSVMRRATTLDPALNRRRGVSENWLRRQFIKQGRDKTGAAIKPSVAMQEQTPRQNIGARDIRQTVYQTGPKEIGDSKFEGPEGEPERGQSNVDDSGGAQ